MALALTSGSELRPARSRLRRVRVGCGTRVCPGWRGSAAERRGRQGWAGAGARRAGAAVARAAREGEPLARAGPARRAGAAAAVRSPAEPGGASALRTRGKRLWSFPCSSAVPRAGVGGLRAGLAPRSTSRRAGGFGPVVALNKAQRTRHHPPLLLPPEKAPSPQKRLWERQAIMYPGADLYLLPNDLPSTYHFPD